MPIGNEEDVSLRALRVLKEVALVVAEDSRITRRFLMNYSLETNVITFGRRDTENVLSLILTTLKSGKSVALVSDSGTPAIADPGLFVIQECLNIGTNITGIHGANAAVLALSISGFSDGRFVFEGFPPRVSSERQAFFEYLRYEPRTIVIYESPRFLLSTLKTLRDILGQNRKIMLGFNLTKQNEKIFRGNLEEAILFAHSEKKRGEITLVIEGNRNKGRE